MIEKSFPVPACTRYTLDFPLSLLRACGKIRRVRLSHMKEEGGALVCAEGTALKYNFRGQLDGLYCIPAELLFFSMPAAQFTRIGKNYFTYVREQIHSVVECYDKNGNQFICFLTETHLYRVYSTSYMTVANFGGTCAALHYERLYFASGERLYYTEPMVYTTLTTDTTYGGGYIDFPDAGGKILEIVSFKDKLYLFRERGITAVTAFGDPLNFKTAALPYSCGDIITGSVACCGEKIYFFTQNGFYSFDGSLCKKVENADEDDVDLTAAIHSVCYGGRYYAGIKKSGGTRVFYSYDPKTERGRYINLDCNLVAANDKLYFTSGNTIYEFSGKALPENGECALEVVFTPGDQKAGEKFAESVYVAGAGGITLSLVSDRGEKTAVKGRCGKLIRLPRALRGETFGLKITPDDADFEIRSVSVCMRRDDK